jgi:hypothetical protein
MIRSSEKIVRIRDLEGNLQDWAIVDRIVNKYNPEIITYEVELGTDRSLFTQIYESKMYPDYGASGFFYMGVLPTGSGDNYARATFMGFHLGS